MTVYTIYADQDSTTAYMTVTNGSSWTTINSDTVADSIVTSATSITGAANSLTTSKGGFGGYREVQGLFQFDCSSIGTSESFSALSLYFNYTAGAYTETAAGEFDVLGYDYGGAGGVAPTTAKWRTSTQLAGFSRYAYWTSGTTPTSGSYVALTTDGTNFWNGMHRGSGANRTGCVLIHSLAKGSTAPGNVNNWTVGGVSSTAKPKLVVTTTTGGAVVIVPNPVHQYGGYF